MRYSHYKLLLFERFNNVILFGVDYFILAKQDLEESIVLPSQSQWRNYTKGLFTYNVHVSHSKPQQYFVYYNKRQVGMKNIAVRN